MLHKVPNDRFKANTVMQCAGCQNRFTHDNKVNIAQNTHSSSNSSSRNIKLLAAILSVIVVLLLLMVVVFLFRNQKIQIPLDGLPEQVKVVLLGNTEEDAKDIISTGLVLSVKEGYKLYAKNKTEIIVVKGTVSNPTGSIKKRILLEGSMVDKTNTPLFTTRAPCGKLIADKRLKKTSSGEFSKLFTRNMEFIDCTLNPGEEKPFQMIFDDIPRDFNTEYSVKVKPLFAAEERLPIEQGTEK